MKFVFFILFAVNAFADDASKVCRDITDQQNSSQSRLSTFNLLRGVMFPSEIVQLKQLTTPVSYVQSQNGNNHIIINILKNGDLNTDREELNIKVIIYNNIVKSIKENNFARKASELSNVEDCVKLSVEFNQDFVQFMDLSHEMDKYTPFQKQLERLESFQFVKNKMGLLISRGWTLHDTLDVRTISKVMMDSPEQVIIISHSTSDGVIIDANNSALPSSVFSNTPTSLRKLSLFSCYVDKVQKTYHLQEMVRSGRFDLVYPDVRPSYKKYFVDATPLLALSALSKFHRKKKMMPVRSLIQGCSVRFDQDISNLDIAIYINNHFVGLVKDIQSGEKKIYCDLLKDENSVSLNLIDKQEYQSENLSSLPNSLIIKNGSNSSKMNLKHFFRENRYLSSKTIKE